jgi:hypothetical protein
MARKSKKRVTQLLSNISITKLLLETLQEVTPRWKKKNLLDELGITGTQLRQLETKLNRKVALELQGEIEAALLLGEEVEIANVLAIEAKSYKFRTGGINHLAVSKGQPAVEKPIVEKEGLRLSVKTRLPFKKRLNN